MREDRLRAIGLALFLVAATVLVFAAVVGFEFITYDDNVYVTENPHVQAGLTWTSFQWAWGVHECNWHPLTWLSLMLDAELAGLRPAGFHLVNLLLHTTSVLLLFFLLARMTGALYRSGFAALLFAIHPLHVESVAWIAERKDVLSACFWFLTMHAYVSYTRRPSMGRYALTAGAFAAGLLCKPMLVTLPLALLLCDLWPLARLVPPTRRIVLEKVPLLALSLASSVITLIAQQRGGAVARFVEYPLGVRLENAVVSVIAYIGKMFWPVRLSVFYPHPGDHLPSLAVGLCGALFAVTSIAAIYAARSRPYLTFGWLWYLVTLLPVIGIVQVGEQGMADRYTYIPLVGPFVALCWAVPDLVSRIAKRRPGAVLAVVCGASALALGWRAHAQVALWRDGVTLFEHALTVTTDNAVAHSNLGRAYLDRGELDRAMTHAREVVRIQPFGPDGYFNLGVVFEKTGRTEDAVGAYREAIRIAPGLAGAHLNLGIVLAGQGMLEQAEEQLRDAVRIRPESFTARNNLGVVLAERGALEEAIEQFVVATRLEPANEEARANLQRARELRLRASP